MALRQSAEDYLETILILKKEIGVVHSVDVANRMDFSKPSVSRAVGNLKTEGYLLMRENGELELTEQGLAAARAVYERHTVLTGLLTRLGVSEEVATEDACNVEHVISDDTFNRLRKLYYDGLPDEKVKKEKTAKKKKKKSK